MYVYVCIHIYICINVCVKCLSSSNFMRIDKYVHDFDASELHVLLNV